MVVLPHTVQPAFRLSLIQNSNMQKTGIVSSKIMNSKDGTTWELKLQAYELVWVLSVQYGHIIWNVIMNYTD